MRTRGFSLLEVLVALAVLALAMTALVGAASREARGLADARERTLAQWVAANALTQARLDRALPAFGLRQGEETLGGRRWRWQLAISATETGIRRLEVSVAAAEQPQPVLVLTGFAPVR